MKIGMIFECGPNGPDKKVCIYAAKCLAPNITFLPVSLANKRNLINNCGAPAKMLLDIDNCDRVIIVWDLYPSWTKGKPCRRHDVEQIQCSLDKEDICMDRIRLVCIEREMEAWLLADERALSQFLSRDTHKVELPRKNWQKKPDSINKPKARMKKLFKDNKHYPYDDKTDAIKIARAVPNYARIRKSPSFRRFAEAITGKPLG